MSGPLFLPWLRRGIGQGLGVTDDLSGPLPHRGEIMAFVDLEDDQGGTARAEHGLSLLGPGDVVGLSASQVVRRYPESGASDAETGYFPLVEMVAPELPWILTPAAPTAENALRPWLVLVVCEVREGVEYDWRGDLTRGVLSLSAAVAQDELPDLADSYAWSHVQSLVEPSRVGAEVDAASGAVIARFVCPRRLLPARSYRAALVPAFDLGVRTGMGQAVEEPFEIRPAWDLSAPAQAVNLPVYLSWTFTTAAEGGTFETLCRRLEPDLGPARLGYRATLLEDPGLLEPFAGDTPEFDFAGALVDPATRGNGMTRDARAWFQDGMTEVLDRSAGDRQKPEPEAGYVPERDDPVVGPPLYGCWAANRFTVPDEGWLRCNVSPPARSASGLGAQAVRNRQNDLLAAAWDQVGDLKAVNEELNRGRLAAEVARSHTRRLAAMDDAALLQVSKGLHAHVATRGGTVASSIASMDLPRDLLSAPFLRQTRSAGLVARRTGAGPEESVRPLVGRTTDAFLDVAVSDDPGQLQSVADFGKHRLPDGAFVDDLVTAVTAEPSAGRGWTGLAYGVRPLFKTEPRIVGLGRLERDVNRFLDDVLLGSAGRAGMGPAQPEVAGTPVAPDVVADSAAALRSYDALPAVRSGLVDKVAGLEELLLPEALPCRVQVGPRFSDPMVDGLIEMGPELLLPGVEAFDENRVRFLSVNEAFVAAFLVGANHEWAREALWNEYPADLGATSFHRFWPHLDPDRADLDADMHLWGETSTLESHVGGEGTNSVVLLRGDVVRRYPGVLVSLVAAQADGEPPIDLDGVLDATAVSWPTFRGSLDERTLYVGFDRDISIDPATWFVSIEEPVTEPRFALDDMDSRHFGKVPRTTWANATWGHVTTAAEEAAMTHVRFANAPWLAGRKRDGATWARNSAHQARATFQQPFRLLLPAAYLMGADG